MIRISECLPVARRPSVSRRAGNPIPRYRSALRKRFGLTAGERRQEGFE